MFQGSLRWERLWASPQFRGLCSTGHFKRSVTNCCGHVADVTRLPDLSGATVRWPSRASSMPRRPSDASACRDSARTGSHRGHIGWRLRTLGRGVVRQGLGLAPATWPGKPAHRSLPSPTALSVMSPPVAIPSRRALTSSRPRREEVLRGGVRGPVTFEFFPSAEPVISPPATTAPRPARTLRPLAVPPPLPRNRAITETSSAASPTTAPATLAACPAVSKSASTAVSVNPTAAAPVTTAVAHTHTRAAPVKATSHHLPRNSPSGLECSSSRTTGRQTVSSGETVAVQL